MSKVLLVEDDNNLRDIYEARMQAEGFEIVSAHDGEEGLIVAKNEHPDLIISDVMMPKISGFEMLDIIRATPTLNNVKIIMLTALGQTDDQDRADKLGADRYLVKSQVTLEDIVKVAHEVLNDLPNNPNLNNVPVEPSNDQPTTDNSQQDTLNPNTSNTQESTENQQLINQANDQLNINSTNHEPLTPPSLNQQNNGQKIINPISTNRSFLSNPESQPSNNDQSFNEN